MIKKTVKLKIRSCLSRDLIFFKKRSMKKNQKEPTPPLPKRKPASYDNQGPPMSKEPKERDVRKDKGVTSVKSDKNNPQKLREKIEFDHDKPERDPGMTKR